MKKLQVAILLSSVAGLVLKLHQEQHLEELNKAVAKLEANVPYHIHDTPRHTHAEYDYTSRVAGLQDKVDVLSRLNTDAHGKLKHEALQAMADHELMFHIKLHGDVMSQTTTQPTEQAADEHETEPEQPDDLPGLSGGSCRTVVRVGIAKTCGDLGTKMVVDRAGGGQDSWLCGLPPNHTEVKHAWLRSDGTPHRQWLGPIGSTYHHTVNRTTRWPYGRVSVKSADD